MGMTFIAYSFLLSSGGFETIRQAKDETLAWLLWYKQSRMHSTLGHVSPIQFE
jgi:transposase InsO family protein